MCGSTIGIYGAQSLPFRIILNFEEATVNSVQAFFVNRNPVSIADTGGTNRSITLNGTNKSNIALSTTKQFGNQSLYLPGNAFLRIATPKVVAASGDFFIRGWFRMDPAELSV